MLNCGPEAEVCCRGLRIRGMSCWMNLLDEDEGQRLIARQYLHRWVSG